MTSLTEARKMLTPRQAEKAGDTWLGTKSYAGGSWTGPINPMMADNIRSDNTQNPMPESNDNLVPIYLPATLNAKGMSGGKEPVNTVKVMTRGEYMDKCMGKGKFHGDTGVNAVYKFYAYAWVMVAITIIVAFLWGPYFAAIPAFLAGTYWSEKEVSTAWDIQWLKSKMLVHMS